MLSEVEVSECRDGGILIRIRIQKPFAHIRSLDYARELHTGWDKY